MKTRNCEDDEDEWDYYFDMGFHADRYSQDDL